MKMLRNTETEAELKGGVAYKKVRILFHYRNF